jgi:hypothetical protein
MRRGPGPAVIGLLVAAGVPGLPDDTAGAPSNRQAVVVRLFDYARQPEAVLDKAVPAARSLLREAGVETDWRRVGGREASHDREVRCADPDATPELRVELFGRGQTRALAQSSNVLGVSLLPARGGQGLYAAVYVEEADALSRPSGVPLAVVLGAAMAHEIGHLLLGTHDHSTAGLMRAQWSSKELERAAQGQLRFSEDESARLRRAMASRTLPRPCAPPPSPVAYPGVTGSPILYSGSSSCIASPARSRSRCGSDSRIHQ